MQRSPVFLFLSPNPPTLHPEKVICAACKVDYAACKGLCAVCREEWERGPTGRMMADFQQKLSEPKIREVGEMK
jgi:predicted amidophosphoribosyltransferase